jgi:hypothetical protein
MRSLELMSDFKREITCLLCSGRFENNDTSIKDHFDQRHAPIEDPIELTLLHYVLALQQKIERLSERAGS